MTRSKRAPRVGCVGTGWIGLNRLEALKASGLVEIAAICDPNPEARARAAEVCPDAASTDRYEALLEQELDAVVIATPSGQHAEQCIQAFERGFAVFCQKPLARTAEETRAVVAAAQAADRLLAVDLCYRETSALRRTRELVRSGAIGVPFAAELVFHNAYGPDKSWAFDPGLAGGGCLVDLGVHLVDAALWILDFPKVERARAQIFREGAPADHDREVEDFATGSFSLAGGATVTLACSWRSSFGAPARIRAQFFGSRGGVAFQNVAGSFFDFECALYRGTSAETLVTPPDDWGGRAIVAWAERLVASPSFVATPGLLSVAEVLDSLYGRVRAEPPGTRAARGLLAESP